MERKTLTCICCPIGCTIEAELEGNHVLSVRGNSCPRGEKYAKSELSNPVRTLTSRWAHGKRNGRGRCSGAFGTGNTQGQNA